MPGERNVPARLTKDELEAIAGRVHTPESFGRAVIAAVAQELVESGELAPDRETELEATVTASAAGTLAARRCITVCVKFRRWKVCGTVCVDF